MLMQLFGQSNWREMHLVIGDFELFLSKDSEARVQPLAIAAPVSEPVRPRKASVPARPVAERETTGHADAPAGWTIIKAPSLGTFYRAPKPGAPVFTDIGARVTGDTELCLIEVMKLFTTLRAGISGTVAEIYAKDGDLVEFDQPLFLIEPHA